MGTGTQNLQSPTPSCVAYLPGDAIYDALLRTIYLDPDGMISDWLGVVVAASTGVQYKH